MTSHDRCRSAAIPPLTLVANAGGFATTARGDSTPAAGTGAAIGGGVGGAVGAASVTAGGDGTTGVAGVADDSAAAGGGSTLRETGRSLSTAALDGSPR